MQQLAAGHYVANADSQAGYDGHDAKGQAPSAGVSHDSFLLHAHDNAPYWVMRCARARALARRLRMLVIVSSIP